MTPNEMVAAIRRLGVAARLDQMGRPAGVLPGSGYLAVIWPATDPGGLEDTEMAEPLRLCLYRPATPPRRWEHHPFERFPGLTADETLRELGAWL